MFQLRLTGLLLAKLKLIFKILVLKFARRHLNPLFINFWNSLYFILLLLLTVTCSYSFHSNKGVGWRLFLDR